MTIHFSIDDVVNSFLWINRVNAESIFESTVFDFARTVKEKFDIGVTFNCMYSNDSGGTLCEVSDKWKKEFEDNSEWFKVSFHSLDAKRDYNSISSYEFAEDFNIVNEQLERIAGNCIDNEVLRLHYFHASHDAVRYLSDQGVKILLSADDDRLNYDLSDAENERLNELGEYNPHRTVSYIKTDFRVERFTNAIEYTPYRDKLVFFTHEKLLMQESIRKKILEYLDNLSKKYVLANWR